ncbi:MAG: hypothetical protein AB7G62_07140 [Magnetospirillum sp.]
MMDSINEALGVIAGACVFALWFLGMWLSELDSKATVRSTPDYAIEISVDFQYAGEHYHRVFLSSLHDVRSGDGSIRWQFTRHEFLVALNDGSALLIPAGALESWHTQYTTKAFPAVGAQKQARASRWFWLDNAAHPTKVLSVNFDPKVTPKTDFQVLLAPDNVISANMVRLGADHLEKAQHATEVAEKSRRLGGSGSGMRDFIGKGVLFGGLEASEVLPQAVGALERLEGWEETGGGCKVLRWNQDNHAVIGQAMVGGRKFEPVQLANGVWQVAEKTYPLNKMFRLGQVDLSDREFINGHQVLSYVSALDNGVSQCAVPKWDLKTEALAVLFPDHRAIVMHRSAARAIFIESDQP